MKKLLRNNKISFGNTLLESNKDCFVISVVSEVKITSEVKCIELALEEEMIALRSKYYEIKPNSIPKIAFIRNIMKSQGRNPNRYLHSAESLLKRVLKGSSLHAINNVVGINNLLSLKYLVPVGSYDINKIDGKILLDIGKEDDIIKSLKKEDLNISGLPALYDSLGAFGTIISDSRRTLIKSTSKEILTVLFFFKKPEDCQAIEMEIIKLFNTHLNPTSINIFYHEKNI